MIWSARQCKEHKKWGTKIVSSKFSISSIEWRRVPENRFTISSSACTRRKIVPAIARSAYRRQSLSHILNQPEVPSAGHTIVSKREI
ncbi:hypothetical protein L1987_12441 [Smallanthus sonchifolius]|uniref:Uncharacterized protein n=1 Tax=Smallanthus sonchifolius TaxID=185202 RepID=A0ACB9JG25_9ASTR|nr:hypothetical protein L1987_12441 [Smallanthus sonchifolius]